MSKLTLKTEGCLPRSHRSKTSREMDARPRRLDDARLHQ
jgi:hypothetical protein